MKNIQITQICQAVSITYVISVILLYQFFVLTVLYLAFSLQASTLLSIFLSSFSIIVGAILLEYSNVRTLKIIKKTIQHALSLCGVSIAAIVAKNIYYTWLHKRSVLFILNCFLKKPNRLTMKRPLRSIFECSYNFSCFDSVHTKGYYYPLDIDNKGGILSLNSKFQGYDFNGLSLSELDEYISQENMKKNPAGHILSVLRNN